MTSAIASVEDALGLPSPEDLAEGQAVNAEEVSKQADGKKYSLLKYHTMTVTRSK